MPISESARAAADRSPGHYSALVRHVAVVDVHSHLDTVKTAADEICGLVKAVVELWRVNGEFEQHRWEGEPVNVHRSGPEAIEWQWGTRSKLRY